MHRPSELTCEEAVTMPAAFLTALYALHHLARIQAGERILIHAATGGVGLAALQIAQHVGAEVFATAGSPEKRELLQRLGVPHVMDSRSLAFADQILEITGGQGVDIVLNSLAGKAIARGIACLAPYGRFLELGKRDIYQNSKLGLWGFRKNVSFFAIDMGDLGRKKPAFIKAWLGELSRAIEANRFHPLPHRVFPVSRAVDAFRHMAQARHIGKIVISLHTQGVSVAPRDRRYIAFRPDATYLITGGFGGLGLTLARWIIEHGGRYLVLMGRSGAASEEAQSALEDLQRTGARVVAARADVTSAQQVADVLADIGRTLPPLRGIFHAAGELMPMLDRLGIPVTDLQTEAVLDPTIDPQGVPAEPVGEPMHILLTGATGFLGAFLLRALLQQTSARLYCLVLARDAGEGQQKIQRTLESYGLWQEGNGARIVPVVGDLSRPLLGQSAGQFHTLAHAIDTIYHNGAFVNWIYPYQRLKPTNVLGTQEVLRLASQAKVKPVHFISTLAVFPPLASAATNIVREPDTLDHGGMLYGGYA